MSDRDFISLCTNSDINKIDNIREILNEHMAKRMLKRKDFVRYHQLLNDRYMKHNNINADSRLGKEKSVYQLIKEVIASNAKYH